MNDIRLISSLCSAMEFLWVNHKKVYTCWFSLKDNSAHQLLRALRKRDRWIEGKIEGMAI